MLNNFTSINHSRTTHGTNETGNILSTTTVSTGRTDMLSDSLENEIGLFDGSGEGDVDVVESTTPFEQKGNAVGGDGGRDDRDATKHVIFDGL